MILAYRELAGFASADLTKRIADVFAESGLDLGKLCSFTADGASVMGTRAALSAGGDNVAAKLSEAAARPLLITHCSAHKLQLSVSAALHADPYLADFELNVHRLFRFFRGPSGVGDTHTLGLIFWADVAEEGMVASLGTAKARWLSLLDPLKRIERSYITILAYLAQLFETETDREKRKKTQQVHQFLASWEFRFTLAGAVDILSECWAAKAKLETRATGSQLRQILDELEAGLAVLNDREQRVAAQMYQLSSRANRAVVAEGVEPGTAVERCLVAYGKDRGGKLVAPLSVASRWPVSAGRIAASWAASAQVLFLTAHSDCVSCAAIGKTHRGTRGGDGARQAGKR